MYSLFVRGFDIKWFVWVLFLVFVGLQFCFRGFLQVSFLCLSQFWISERSFMSTVLVCLRFQGLNVREFLQIQSVSFSEVWLSSTYKVYLT